MSFLFTAYMIIWISLFAYLMSLARKQQRLDREIETLKKILDQKK